MVGVVGLGGCRGRDLTGPVGTPVASVAVSPADTVLERGESLQLTATPKDSAGNALTVRELTWSSSDSLVARVSSFGLVTGVGVGSATVTAAVDEKRGPASVTIREPVVWVGVSPADTVLAPGESSRLTATLKDAAGNALTGRLVTWSSSDPSVGTVSASGLVTAVGIGSATVTAVVEKQHGTATVTVAPGAPIAFTSVSAGGAHTCGLAPNGEAYCWALELPEAPVKLWGQR